MRDPYDVLGVSRKATEAEIKKAFRALAKKHHPDAQGNDPKAVKRFQEISGAYELLSDKEKRAQYDRGEIDANGQPKGFEQGFRPGAGFGHGFDGTRGRTGRAGPGGFEFQWSGGEGLNAEDIFADLFGGLGGGTKRRGASRKGDDIQLQTTVTLQEAATGGVRRVVAGDGRELEVRIPPGVKDGQQIRLRGQGAPADRGGPSGDALIEIAIAPHPFFQRDGRDLRMDLPISLREAVLGANVVLTGSSKIIDVTGPKPVEYKSYVPPRSVVIPGTIPKSFPAGEFQVPCALIIGTRKESTDKKTSLNDALRENQLSV